MADERRYEGVSPDGNLQEALTKAIQQIQRDIPAGGVSDSIARWHLAEIRGQYGGVAGLHSVAAVIVATQGPANE